MENLYMFLIQVQLKLSPEIFGSLFLMDSGLREENWFAYGLSLVDDF